MTFAKSFGGLLKQTKNLTPSVCRARRCTSSSKPFYGARIIIDKETASSSRSSLVTSKFEKNATRPMYGISQKELALTGSSYIRGCAFHGGGSRSYSSGTLASQMRKSALPMARPSMNHLAMQYLSHTKNKMHFDPIIGLNHFVVPCTAVDGTKEENLDKRIRSRIAYFLQNSTSDKNELIHFIRSANELRFVEKGKTGVSLFPFTGATLFFSRDSVGLYSKMNFEEARENLIRQLKNKCWNLMGNEKVMLSIDKFIDSGETKQFQKGIELMLEIILRNRRVPYGYNSYLNEVKKMRSFVSNATNTNTVIESVKIKSIYQSASLIAQDIAVQMRSSKTPFRSIFSRIVKDIPLHMPKGVEGIRISCSGRLGGVEIARTECGKYGKTSRSSFSQKIDYAYTKVSTRHGILGVKVWISYSKNKKATKSF